LIKSITESIADSINGRRRAHLGCFSEFFIKINYLRNVKDKITTYYIFYYKTPDFSSLIRYVVKNIAIGT